MLLAPAWERQATTTTKKNGEHKNTDFFFFWQDLQYLSAVGSDFWLGREEESGQNKENWWEKIQLERLINTQDHSSVVDFKKYSISLNFSYIFQHSKDIDKTRNS